MSDIYYFDDNRAYVGSRALRPNPRYHPDRPDSNPYLYPPAGTWTEVEPPPELEGSFRIWDGTAWQYQVIPEPPPPPEPTLEEAIAIKKSRIDAERDRRIARLTWNGRTWDFDSRSQQLILAEATYSNAGVRPDDGVWIDADNNPVTLSNADFIALATAGREHYESLFFVGREHKNGLGNLTSIEEIEAYPDWPESVP